MARIFVIDDEPSICSALEFALEDDYTVESTTDPVEGKRWLLHEDVDLCLLDLKIGNVDGIELLQEVKQQKPALIVIMITAYGTIESSVKALQLGAYSYLTKPVNMDELQTVVKQALHYNALTQQVEYLSRELERKYRHEGMIGNSSSMNRVYQMIDKVKDVDTHVLITGESGTGKELVARAIHFSGQRKKEHFEVVNCAAIPEHLLESELFGFEKGAFTGATSSKQGKFEMANHGTIFLDEIGDMPLALQAKLLRVLQQKEVTRLGSNHTKQLNVRVISATNKDLLQAVRNGTFREDLYYRLNVIAIDIPPLRKRREDIKALIAHFLHQNNDRLNTSFRGISKEAEKCLTNYNFPGNVRELANIMEASMVIADPPLIEYDDLPSHVCNSHSTSQMEPVSGDHFVGQTLKEVEKAVIAATLNYHDGQRKKTAEMLGISERGLRDKIKQYQIKK